jgi:hypothetical protein
MTAGESPDPALHAAQLERVHLDNDKLRLELAALRRGRPWYQLPVQIVPIVTALVAVGGFSWGIVQYSHEQSKNRAEQARQSVRRRETAEREFMKPWLDSQRETYAQALSAAATVANATDADARRRAADEFWRLYQGRMILVETKTVSGAMVAFGHCLDGTTACSKSELNDRCRALATAMAESMAATARMTFQEFAANQFKYTSGR